MAAIDSGAKKVCKSGGWDVFRGEGTDHRVAFFPQGGLSVAAPQHHD